MNATIMHINYMESGTNSYGARTIDDICKIAAELGFDGIEFRGAPPKELADMSFREYAEAIAAAKKKYGLTEIIFCISMPQCTNPDAEVRARGIAEAIEQAKIVNEVCGTTVCNTLAAPIKCPISTVPPRAWEFHGSAASKEEDWKLTADAYQQLGAAVLPLGMKFGFETHMRYLHDVPVATKKLVDMIDSPAIGVNMDYGNAVYFPNCPSVTETIDIYGDKLFYLHLKNSATTSNGRFATALSEGTINHRQYLTKLKQIGFTGPIGIESSRGGDKEWFAKQDIAYFKSIAATLW